MDIENLLFEFKALGNLKFRNKNSNFHETLLFYKSC